MGGEGVEDAGKVDHGGVLGQAASCKQRGAPAVLSFIHFAHNFNSLYKSSLHLLSFQMIFSTPEIVSYIGEDYPSESVLC